MQSLPNGKIPIQDRVIDALQRAQIGNDQDADALEGNDHATANQGADYGMYNNLEALASKYNLGSKSQQFFILPEFQKF